MPKLFACFLALSTALSAQVVDYTFKGHISNNAILNSAPQSLDTTDLKNAFSSGDAFTLTFKLDLGTSDSLPGTGGSFNAAVSDLHFSLDSGAVGTYAGGSMGGSQFLQTYDDLYGTGADTINFYATPAYIISDLNFSNVGQHVFSEFGFNLYSSDQVFSSTSDLGESLGSLLNGPLHVSDFDNMHNVQMVFDEYHTFVYGNIESITVGKVPESIPVGLYCALSVFGLVAIRRFTSLRA